MRYHPAKSCPVLVSFIFILSLAVVAQEEKVIEIESEMVKITISDGVSPTIEWSGNIKIGRLLVMQGARELWGTETEGENTYESPIRYGVHPPDANEPEPAWPLTAGENYTVKIFRWINLDPEEFQLMGEQSFTHTSDPDDESESVEGIKPTLRVNSLTDDFKLDGLLDDAWWNATDSIADLIMTEPFEGGQPEGETVVKVFTDKDNIVVIARCYDEDPDQIVSYSKSRDSNLNAEGDIEMFIAEDHLLLVFDTFLDGRSGYVFAVNPTGARFDGLVVEQGEDVNREWDSIWEARTSIDSTGWIVEIRIPIQSLGFKKGLDTWGFNVQRRVQRSLEISRWSGISRDFEIYQTNVGGLLSGLPEFDFGLGLSIRPILVFRASTLDPNADTEYKIEPSLDISQRLGPNLLAYLSLNTDFAEIEVDIRQINLTRFPLFFPERRTFFLEGSDIFVFGQGLDEDNLIPFYSRRIGLFGIEEDNQFEIPINVGGKVVGRVGDTNIGALVVNTREVDSLQLGDIDEDLKVHVPQTTMASVRVRQNVLEQSSVGMLATYGDQLGRSDSWSAGVDLTYRTQEFLDEKNFLVGVWGLRNDREDLEGDKNAYGFRIDYPNDLLDINLMSIYLGDGFDPSLAFVLRNDVHIWEFGGEYNPRPEWDLVRILGSELSATLYNERNNSDWQSYEVVIKPVYWLLESGDLIEVSFEPEGDNPDEAFEIASDIDIPSGNFAGKYEWMRYILGLRTADKRRLSGALKYDFGTYYNGELTTIEALIAYKPSAFLNLEFTTELNKGWVMGLPEDVDEEEAEELVRGDFTEKLFGFRFQLNFSPDLQLTSLTQYDTESGELGTNNRLYWQVDPFGELFIVYNYNLLRTMEKKWEFVSSELPLKVRYTFRF